MCHIRVREMNDADIVGTSLYDSLRAYDAHLGALVIDIGRQIAEFESQYHQSLLQLSLQTDAPSSDSGYPQRAKVSGFTGD